jgi:protein phosphatase
MCRLDFDDGTCVVVRGRGRVGRDPAPAPGVVHVVRLVDESLLLSRTHLEFDVDETGLWVRDCNSTNGSQIELNGEWKTVEPGRAVPALPGSTIYLGGRSARVGVIMGRAVSGRAVLDWGVASRVGAARGLNQDSYAEDPPVFVVADGMGGHAAGDVASRAVVDSLSTLVGRDRVTPELLMACLADARTRMAEIPVSSAPPPGSTLSGVIVTRSDDASPYWMVVNVGDSRTYRWDSHGLQQLSVDHSIAQGLVDAGAVTSAQARSIRIGSVLTRSLQAITEYAPDIWLLPVRPGDRILVCSDGLTRALDDATIDRMLAATGDPQRAAEELVGAVVERRGPDDATALVIDAVAITAA